MTSEVCAKVFTCRAQPVSEAVRGICVRMHIRPCWDLSTSSFSLSSAICSEMSNITFPCLSLPFSKISKSSLKRLSKRVLCKQKVPRPKRRIKIARTNHSLTEESIGSIDVLGDCKRIHMTRNKMLIKAMWQCKLLELCCVLWLQGSFFLVNVILAIIWDTWAWPCLVYLWFLLCYQPPPFHHPQLHSTDLKLETCFFCILFKIDSFDLISFCLCES